MMPIGKKEILILLLCCVLGSALRLYTFDKKSLWIDEIHTYNDSRDDLKGQIKYYKENPTYFHPPLFFILTHTFYPFTRPERDLRIFPLIFGILSIPMIYFLSRQFSQSIAIPCTLALTFMSYHIFHSQNGRPYSLVMFVGMAGLYFFLKHLQTFKRRYLILTAFLFAVLFYTSYSAIPFILSAQILWFYRPGEEGQQPAFSSFLILNGSLLLLCLPWILFLMSNYHGQSLVDPLSYQELGSFTDLVSGILNDWAPHLPSLPHLPGVLHWPLLIISTLFTVIPLILLILLPFVSKKRRHALLLLCLLLIPISGLYLYCKIFHANQLLTSRYFINFLPVFLIALFYSLDRTKEKYDRLNKVVRIDLLFLILFVTSNLLVLPVYYQSEKQDFRNLVNYLNSQIRDGDKILTTTSTYIPGILHYFGVYPKIRHYEISASWEIPGKEFESRISLVSKDRSFTIYFSNIPYAYYISDGSRLWILTWREAAQEIKKSSPAVLKGVFDGSFANFRQFPSDATMYLLLWDPKSPGEKGIEMPAE